MGKDGLYFILGYQPDRKFLSSADPLGKFKNDILFRR
jgi:hypothetical protein